MLQMHFPLSLGRQVFFPLGLQAGSGTGSPRTPSQTERLLLTGFSPTFPNRPQVLERTQRLHATTRFQTATPVHPAKVHTSILAPTHPEAQPSQLSCWPACFASPQGLNFQTVIPRTQLSEGRRRAEEAQVL